jgi:hypothetical protein
MLRAMRRFLAGLSMVLMGCTADTFIGPDGSTPGDGGGGGGDSGTTPDAPFDAASCAPGWCKTQTLQPGTFCTDFDESTTMPADWSAENSNGFTNFVTSPAEQCLSLHAHMGAAPAASTARIVHVSTLLTSGTSVHATLTLDVMLPKNDSGGQVFFYAIRTTTPALSIGLVQRADGTWWLQSSLGTNTLTATLASAGPVRGAFTHMQLDVAYTTSGVAATLAYRRGDNNNSDTITANGSAIAIPTQLTFVVGLEAASQTTSGIDAYYDDVLTLSQ